MVFELLSAVLLAQSSAPAERAPFALALPLLNAVNLVAGEGEMRTELVAQKLLAHHLKVITSRDLGAVLGLDRQKQLLGCVEQSCAVELLAAMGADGLMLGDLARLGGEYTLTLKVLSPRDGHVMAMAMAAGRAATEAELDVLLDRSVRVVLERLADSTMREELRPQAVAVAAAATTTIAPAPGPSLRGWALLPGVAGVLAVGTGVVLQVLAGNAYADLQSHHSPEVAGSLRASGRGLETGGNWSLVGGGVALLAAVVMFLVGSPPTPSSSMALGPQWWVAPVAGVSR
jgi:hypothetical protein